jgi:hypothetical protein
MKTVYVDFNNRDADGYLRLNCNGTEVDLSLLSIRLEEGMRLLASDGDITAEIVVIAPGKEAIWRGEILFDTLIDQS